MNRLHVLGDRAMARTEDDADLWVRLSLRHPVQDLRLARRQTKSLKRGKIGRGLFLLEDQDIVWRIEDQTDAQPSLMLHYQRRRRRRHGVDTFEACHLLPSPPLQSVW